MLRRLGDLPQTKCRSASAPPNPEKSTALYFIGQAKNVFKYTYLHLKLVVGCRMCMSIRLCASRFSRPELHLLCFSLAMSHV